MLHCCTAALKKSGRLLVTLVLKPGLLLVVLKPGLLLVVRKPGLLLLLSLVRCLLLLLRLVSSAA
jgi:hypothetical protein